MNLLAGWTMDMWSPIINLFSFIPNYGWMIIVFTIILKLILSPLDIWQRKVSRDSMMKQQRLQPQIQKLQKQYGNNRELLNKKTMALYKKEGYNVIGSCLSMFINMALTLFIFFTLFTGLAEISQDKTYKQYETLEETYKTTFVQELQKTDDSITEYAQVNQLINSKIENYKTEAEQALIDAGTAEPTEEQITAKAYELVVTNEYAEVLQIAQQAVATKYEEIKDSWLWVDSIWRPETYQSGFGNFSDFYSMANLGSKFGENPDRINEISREYNFVTEDIQQKYSSWNGYFILAILAGVITYFSFMLTQNNTLTKKEKKQEPVNGKFVNGQRKEDASNAQQTKGMNALKYIMPIIMIIFVLFYSTAFALYIVTNSLMSVFISLACIKIFEVWDKKKANKDKNPKVEYSR